MATAAQARKNMLARQAALGTDNEALALAQRYGINTPEPQANILERIFTPLSAIGSAPDAFYRAMYEGKNPIATYVENLGEGVQASILGKKPKTFKTTADVLEKMGWKGNDLPTSLARGAVGLVGDVVADPLTYVTFGTASIGKKSAQEVALKTLGKEAAPEAVETLAKKLMLGEGSGVKYLEKVAPDLVPLLKKNVLGRSKELATMLDIPFTGIKKQLPIGSNTSKLLKSLTNPIGAVAELGWTGAKKIAPEATSAISDSFMKMFNRRGYAQSKGMESVLEAIDKFQRGQEFANVEVPLRTEIMNITKQLQELNKADPELVKKLPFFIQGLEKATPEVAPLVEKMRGVLGKSQKQLVSKGILEKVDPNYWKQHVLGFTPDFLKNENMSDLVGAIKASDKAQQELKKGYVGIDTINEIIGGAGFGKPSRGIKNIETYLEGSLNPRTYENLQKGIAAGVKYNDNVEQVFLNTLINQKKATNAYDFAKRLTKIKDDFGLPVFKSGIQLQEEMGGKIPRTWREVDLGLDEATKATLKTSYDDLAKIENEIGRLQERLSNKGGRLQEQIRTLKGKSVSKGGKVIENMIQTRKDKLGGITVGIDDTISKLNELKSAKLDLREQISSLEKQTKFYAPKEAVDIIKNYATNVVSDDGINTFLKGYDEALGMFKKSVTGMGPLFVSYNVKNLTGDLVNMALGGFTNKDDAFKKAGIATKLWDEIQKNGLDVIKDEKLNPVLDPKTGVKAYDLIKESFLRGLTSGSQVADELGKKAGFAMGKKELKTSIDDALSKITLSDLSQKRENFTRMANMWDNYVKFPEARLSDRWARAARSARMSSLDFNNLTPFEKSFMKRVIPFYSFMRQNLEHQLNVLSKAPRNMALQAKIYNSIRKMSPSGMTQEDWDALPEWMKSGLSIPLGKDASGTASVISSFGEPTTALGQIFGTTPQETGLKLLSATSPAIKIPLEQAFGVNAFTGKPIVSDTNREGINYKDFPDFIKQLIGYREVERTAKDGTKYIQRTVDPKKVYWLSNTPLLSPFNTLAKRILNAKEIQGASATDIAELLQPFTGTKVYKKNINAAKTQAEKEKQRLIEDELYRMGLGKTYTKFYLDKGPKKKKVKKIG